MNFCYCIMTGTREQTTVTRNEMTGEPLLLCALHAAMHRNGEGFAVYKESV